MQAQLTGIVGAIERTVLRAGGGVGAERGVPGVAGVAVVASASRVQPAPVGVEDDRALLGLAVVLAGALLNRELRVALRGKRADLLAVRDGEERE